jgi:multidrug efflux pump
MSLIDAAINRSRTVLAVLVLILLAGTVAFIEIPKESEPDINIPIIYVSMNYDGISPEDAERLLIRPMEVKLRAIEGVKEMRARGFEGGAYVVLEFDAGFNVDKALVDVREKVDQAKADLPEETDEPTVSEVNFSLFPVVVVALAGDVPERTLLRLARDLRDEIRSITSVLDVEIAGEREEQVEILIDPFVVESYGFTAEETFRLVRNNNLLIAAGAQDTGQGRFSIKVPGLLETAPDIHNLPVKVGGDAVVTVADIGEVRRSFQDAEGFARINGQPAIVLEVTKRTGENLIDTVQKVRAVVAAERAAWPEGLQQAIHIALFQDKSEHIRTMLSDLQNSVVFAVLLVMIVIVAALGVRSAALVGIAIPGSFLAGILVLTALGLTINIVVLFALILAVGMLVDGAIVVTELADRKMIEGAPPATAYATAAKRMAWPVTAATATTLAAFLPLLFWPGVVGEFMKYLPITLLATLTASLAMALVFVPTLGALIGRPGTADAKTMKSLAGSEDGDIADVGGWTGRYLAVLRAALRHPGKILLAAVILLVGVQVVYANFGKGIEFFPDVEPDIAKLQVRARGNLSAYEKDGLIKEVENRILGMSEIETVYARTGTPERSEEAEDIIGTITLEFAPWEHRRPAQEILAEIKARTADIAGIFVDPREEEAGPPVGKPVQIELASRHPELLAPSVEQILAGLARIGGMENIEDSRPLPGIDWELRIDRAQAAKFGVDAQSLGSTVQMVTTGIKVDGIRPNDADDEIDIRIRYPEQYRTIDKLDQVRVNTEAGPVPVSNFVTLAPQPRVGMVERTDSRRVMTIKADVAAGVLADTKVREIQAWLAEADIDHRVQIAFKGEDEEQNQAKAFLVKAFGVAVFLMAIILVTQFNSFYSAFLILSAVVMSTIGVFIGLLVTGQPFGIVMGGIGVIALAGIVVNNNIVLIDTFDRLARTAKSPLDAILRTGAQRLRPVMLTTITTILGLLPLVFRVNIDFIARHVSIGAPATQWWTQLATAIVFGLAFSTVLTLVVTPCALMLRANIREWRERRRAADLSVLPPPAYDRAAE